MPKKSWGEEDLARKLIIEDLQNDIKNAYINNIEMPSLKVFGRYQAAQDDWGCDVYVQQDENGNVKLLDIQKCNLDDSDKARVHLETQLESAVIKHHHFLQLLMMLYLIEKYS